MIDPCVLLVNNRSHSVPSVPKVPQEAKSSPSRLILSTSIPFPKLVSSHVPSPF